MVADSTAPAELRRHRRHRPGRARSRRAGLAGHLGRGRRRTRSTAAVGGLRGRVAPPGRHRGDVRRRRLRGRWSTAAEQAMAVANAIAPEHLELMVRRPRGARPAGAPRRRRLPRAVGAGVARRLRGRAVARAADPRLGPLRPGPDRGRLHQARPRRHRRRRPRFAALAPHVVALAEAEGLDAHAAVGRACRLGGRRDGRVPGAVRDDLRGARGLPLAAGRVGGPAQHQRGARPPPPDAWRDALAAELVAGRLAPLPGPRRATELRAAIAALHGVAARAGVRGQRLQRGAADAAARLRRRRAHGGHVRADLPAARPHRPHHRRRRWSRASGADDFALDLDEVRRRARRRTPGRHVPVLAEQPHRAWSSPKPSCGRVHRPRRPGLVVVDEAYGQFAPWSALELVDEDAPARRHPHLLQDVVDGGRPPRLPGRPAWLVEELDKVVLPYHLDAAKQIAGRLAFGSPTRWRPRVKPVVRSASGSSPACAELAVDCGRRAPTSCCSGPTAVDGHAVWQACSSARVLVRNCSSWPRLDGCLRVTVGTPAEERRLPGGAGRGAAHDRGASRRGRPASGRPRRPTVEVSIDLDGTGRHRRRRTGLPFFDHMLDQLGRHGGFDLTVQATGDLHVDSHHTVEDIAIVLGEAFREALGDKAGVRRFASGSFPLDEALVEVALDLSGRPFVVWDVRCPRASRSATRRSTRSWPSTSVQSFATAAGITLHVTLRRGRNIHHIIEATFKGVARCLRDAVRVEGTAACRPPRACCDDGADRAARRRPRLRHRQPALGRRRRSSTSGADARLTADRGPRSPRPRRGAARRRRLRRVHGGPAARRASRRSPSTPSASGRPFLGICVGMQMLFEGSEEDPGRRRARRASRARCAGSRPA